MIIAVTGSRHGEDRDLVAKALSEYATPGNVLVNGGATGFDTLAYEYWIGQQLPAITVPAPWKRSGRAAGPQRNATMLKGIALSPNALYMVDLLVAFPGGRGTASAVGIAEKLGIEVFDLRNTP